MIIWYLAPALVGPLNTQAELTWALTVTLLSGATAKQVEKVLEEEMLPAGLSLIVIILFLITLIFFLAFTYQKPWIDLFVDPLTIGSH